ncbi:hypothetical protein DSO57_1002286 [Entomophthora muscae]|uniref:Uncharacterized protein n=1 Tax=Entomophthora muscae TaxID=34485 RepID=A0ACC2TJT3_9FUNG|nr:hypothetical protein DSO57_1002286 [Entomophthora muscae]
MQFYSFIAFIASASADISFAQLGCRATHSEKLRLHQQNIPAKCFVKPQTGHCYAYFPSFFYDAAENECKESVFGGCNDGCFGFNTKNECENSCIKMSIQPVPKQRTFMQSSCRMNATGVAMAKYKDLPSKCLVPTKVGNCRARIPSYHFDATVGHCVRGNFGGCQDGCQAFATQEECDKACH